MMVKRSPPKKIIQADALITSNLIMTMKIIVWRKKEKKSKFLVKKEDVEEVVSS